jgi:transposase
MVREQWGAPSIFILMGYIRWQPGYGKNKRGLNSKLHLAITQEGTPIRFTVTEGQKSDCTEAEQLIKDQGASYVIADKAYDTDSIIKITKDLGMDVVIPPKKNRKEQRCYDTFL